MNFYNLYILIFLIIFLQSCGSSSENDSDLFAVTISNSQKSYKNADILQVSLNNKKNKTLDSVAYFLGSKRISSNTEAAKTNVPLASSKLGKRKVIAKVYSGSDIFIVSSEINVLASQKPKLYSYEILETYPHDINAYTQGLEFDNDTLYESTGLYGKSTLRKTNVTTGEVYKKVELADRYFGEGLSILNGKIFQLTWKEKTGLIYNVGTLKESGQFTYNVSKEGWGLCNDGKKIYKSDGTEKIWTLNPNTLKEESYIEIYTHSSKIDNVNELEWVDGKIYANIYEKGSVAIVNPDTGAVEGIINLKGLKDEVTQHPDLNVLNGIAYKGEKNILYITGKNWDKLFKIAVVE